jgi:multiple sugar transport system permease protein
MYEAAECDGAGPVGRFWWITVPLLKPVLAVVILFSAIFTLADFNIVYILTKGGPINMTHLFATYSFAIGLQSGQIGLGAAVSLFLFPILLAVVFFQLGTVRKATTYE